MDMDTDRDTHRDTDMDTDAIAERKGYGYDCGIKGYGYGSAPDGISRRRQELRTARNEWNEWNDIAFRHWNTDLFP
jgi:hypothetical protein